MTARHRQRPAGLRELPRRNAWPCRRPGPPHGGLFWDGRAGLCGLFRTPSLRNVAPTAPYFHNASFASLEDVVAFYATRDIDPARWHPTVGGQVQVYNDLPAVYRPNLQQGAPFRRAGQTPALSPQDAADIVAFLNTLTDGFTPTQTGQ